MTDNSEPQVSEDGEQVVSESQIAVHWREEEYYYPPESFVAQANANDPAIFDRFSWTGSRSVSPSTRICWIGTGGGTRCWIAGFRRSGSGSPGAAERLVQLRGPARRRVGNKAALIWVPEPEDVDPVAITYRELYHRVNEFAARLQDFCGLKAGVRQTLHMPMVPERPITMLACARLGVVHSQVFGGFSGNACGTRIADSGSRVLITMDGYYRSGTLTDHKVKADEAVAEAKKQGQEVDKVLVWRRHPGQYASQTPMVEGRDFFVEEVAGKYRGQLVDPVSMPAEAPLFLMYTSGTTGRPKGAQHSTGGYLSYVAGTSKYYQDIHPGDTYWCMADIGWITGHSYIVYGPLALGTTSVIYEGTPNYPDAGRPWRIAERLGVNIFHTSPTAIRMLRKVGPDEPAKYNYQFKHMTTVGEPIEPEAWRWYHEAVGKGQAVIVDTWWQTETGGFLGSSLPALKPMKPGSCGPAVLGIFPVILDEDGHEVPDGKAGNICITNPWPGIMQTVWGQPERFLSVYYAKYNKDPGSKDWRDWPYFAGDGAVRAPDGYYRILGRVDDVINVAGHRLGTKEIESASLTVPEVAEAAAVPVIDDIRGRAVEVYVSLKPGAEASDEMARKVTTAIETEIGKIARPKNVWIVPDMPRPRSGRSCAGSSPRCPTSPTSATSPPWPTPKSSTASATKSKPPKSPKATPPAQLSDTERAEIQAFGTDS